MLRRLLLTLVFILPCSVWGQDAPPAPEKPKAPAMPMAVKALEYLQAQPNSGPVSWTNGPYVYDGAGNIAGVGSEAFVYDKVGRLQSATVRGPDMSSFQTQSFTYDPYGNLTSTTKLGQTVPLAPDPANTNRLQSLGYDGAGNVITAGTLHYEYDAVGMVNQIRVGTNLSPRIIYAYTADDERLFAFDVSANTTEWTLRGFDHKVLRVFKQTGATWSVERDYVYRDGSLLAALKPGGAVEHYSLDHLGSARLVTDGAGQKVGYHVYWPFGEEWSPGSAQEGNPLEFTGHERDADPSGGNAPLDYMHARYYSAALGRFLSVDPGRDWDLRQPQSWNMYTYVRNNPMNRVDPTGRCGEKADFIGPTVLCAKAESTPKLEPAKAGGRTPAQGQEPASTTEFPAEGGGKTVRTYGPDGRAVTDVDHGHDHGAGDPHVHDWDWDKKRPRQPGRAPNPGEIPEPSKSTTVGQQRPDLQTIIGATIMAIGGTAIMIMTGGGAALQPHAGGVVIVPGSGLGPIPTNASDCPPSSPYCT